MDDRELDIPLNASGNINVHQDTFLTKTAGPMDPSYSEYDFSHPRRGIAVIVVNNQIEGHKEKRTGSEKDMTFFQHMFTAYGFEIRTFFNKKSQDLLKELHNISKEDHSENDCFALAISTHGEGVIERNTSREDVIYTTDQTIKVRYLLELFTDEKCPTLKGKPRIVFIQACRGEELDDGVTVHLSTSTSVQNADEEDMTDLSSYTAQKQVVQQASDDADALPSIAAIHRHGPGRHNFTVQPKPTLVSQQVRQTQVYSYSGYTQEEVYVVPAPCYDDFLVMYATPPGYFAFRRTTEGSWFIKNLAEVLLQPGRRSLLRELTRVIRKVSQNMESKNSDKKYDAKKQSPVIYSKLIKDIYLTPKNGSEY
ncbi:unnamed protein product [Lymnaea stagnalis]|uniref:Caspase-3 n=1 Tax=Lymnaea stagnalis TaxID=6523 RepID=A0AAV2HAC4_LYMST